MQTKDTKEPFPKPFDKEATLRWATGNDHIETCRYLIEQGATLDHDANAKLAIKLVKQQTKI